MNERRLTSAERAIAERLVEGDVEQAELDVAHALGSLGVALEKLRQAERRLGRARLDLADLLGRPAKAKAPAPAKAKAKA